MLKSKRNKATQSATRAPYVSAVTPSAKRQGRRLKKTATVSKQGNLTREQLQQLPNDAQVVIDGNGKVKMAIYYRKG